MLTTPARSENRPPRAASPIGTASSSAAATVEDDVSACSPLITRTAASRTTAPTAITVVRRRRSSRERPAAPGEGWCRSRARLPRCSCPRSLRLVGVSGRAALAPAPPERPGAPRRSAWRRAIRRAISLAMTTVEHDRALDDRHHRRREARDLQRHRGAVEEGEQQRRERDAAGLVAAQQGDRDAEEAEAGGEVRSCTGGCAEQVGQADQAGDRAESSIVLTTMPRASTPLALAADGDSPLARRSKPNLVRLSRTETATPTTSR